MSINKNKHLSKKDVNYKVRYTGGDMQDIKHNHVYDCIAEWYYKDGIITYSIIDETGEPYMYDWDQIEKV